MERNATLVFNVDHQDPTALLTNAAKVTRLLNLTLLGVMHDEGSLHDADVPLLQELAWTADFYLTQAQQSFGPPKVETPRPAPKTRPKARRDFDGFEARLRELQGRALQEAIEPPKTEKPRPAPKPRPTARRDNVISLPDHGSGHAS